MQVCVQNRKQLSWEMLLRLNTKSKICSACIKKSFAKILGFYSTLFTANSICKSYVHFRS